MTDDDPDDPELEDDFHLTTDDFEVVGERPEPGDDFYVICSCGAEWWLDYDEPKCSCDGDDGQSRIELRARS